MHELAWKQHRVLIAIVLGLAWIGMTPVAQAQVAISTGATANMNCTPTLCTATQPQATLSAGKLIQLLKANDVTVNNPFGTPIQVASAIT